MADIDTVLFVIDELSVKLPKLFEDSVDTIEDNGDELCGEDDLWLVDENVIGSPTVGDGVDELLDDVDDGTAAVEWVYSVCDVVVSWELVVVVDVDDGSNCDPVL